MWCDPEYVESKGTDAVTASNAATDLLWNQYTMNKSGWRRFISWSRRTARANILGTIGLLLVTALILTAIFAPLIAGGVDPRSQSFTPFVRPGAEHWFGTDRYGRDIFSRTVYGSRISLQVGFLSVFFGGIVGVTLGLLSGYLGKACDLVISCVVTIMLAFPTLVLALAIVSVLQPSTRNVVIAISIAIVPGLALIVRGSVIAVKQMDYVLACHTTGGSPLRIMLHHILPNVSAPIIVILTASISGAILGEAALSYLGLGVPAPTPSWGQDLSGSARDYFVYAPWIAIFPGVAISLAVFGFNLFGDAVRDILDPRLRNR